MTSGDDKPRATTRISPGTTNRKGMWRSSAVVPCSPADSRAAVEFDVDVLRVSDRRLELVADGPISLDVRYVVRPDPPAAKSTRRSQSRDGGCWEQILARATEAVLAAGAIRLALEQLARELEPARCMSHANCLQPGSRALERYVTVCRDVASSFCASRASADMPSS